MMSPENVYLIRRPTTPEIEAAMCVADDEITHIEEALGWITLTPTEDGNLVTDTGNGPGYKLRKLQARFIFNKFGHPPEAYPYTE